MLTKTHADILADFGALCAGIGGLLAVLSLALPTGPFGMIPVVPIFVIWAAGVVSQVAAWFVNRADHVPLEI